MQLQQIKYVVTAGYVAGICATGLVGGVTSTRGWVAVGAFALLPTLALLMLWNHPAQTLSEAIRAARR